ncbi:hypothetical protein DBB29_24905 [Pandoraea cepalis]|uniref:Uncharacterized protein n=1 Tax=Pandoraea cepalis TaxID=2508294 RepID=A0AAW7MGP3_9BURK|nr:hypothetical protein [Pandoraea cepalis]MDN4571902.1 hypothetical protein [Pandoraea cepalis]MDN4581356.1 hypothetical protein [Pandoraea cepalis]
MCSKNEGTKTEAAHALGYQMYMWFRSEKWEVDHRIVDAGFAPDGSPWVISLCAGGKSVRHSIRFDPRCDFELGPYRLEIRYLVHAAREGVANPQHHAQIVTGHDLTLLDVAQNMVKFGINGMTFFTTSQEWAARENGYVYAMRCK